MDRYWLRGDYELLAEMAERGLLLNEIMGSEVTITDLVNKSKCVLSHNNLTRLYERVKNGEL